MANNTKEKSTQEVVRRNANPSEGMVMEPGKSSIFKDAEQFNHFTNMAKMISSSDLVPQSYKGNVPNVMIALEEANRIGVSPFMVMQNLDIIKGKPSWSSTFIIAALNSCGRFKPLRFKFEGTGDDYGCRAITKDRDGNDLRGPKVDWKMVKSEGWLSKPGSKWKTMPELMFQYRAAAFFGRLYAPDILKGMHTAEETIDVTFHTASVVEEDNSLQDAHDRYMVEYEKALNMVGGKLPKSYDPNNWKSSFEDRNTAIYSEAMTRLKAVVNKELDKEAV